MQEVQSEADQAKALGMAQQEMEYRVDLFNRWRHLELQVLFRFAMRKRISSYSA
jgi:hypothetical protein